MFNFREISQLTLERGAGIQVQNESELRQAISKYLSDPNLRFKTGEAGLSLIQENKGALRKTLAFFSDYLT